MIKRLGIVGAGQMGGGIAQVAAQAGYQVLLADQNQEVAEKGKSRIAAQLKKQIEKGKLTEADSQKILGAIQAVSGIQDFGAVDLAIEAVAENPELKYGIFRKLDR